MGGRLLLTAPGAEAATLDGLATGDGDLLSTPGAIILVGERLATAAGRTVRGGSAGRRHRGAAGLGAAPAGERGALEAGACPLCCPAAGPSPTHCPRPGRRGVARRRDAHAGPRQRRHPGRGRPTATLGALLVGGVEPADFADPDAALAAIEAAGFVVSLELRQSAGHRTRRRRVPGRAGGREGRRIRQLGGPDRGFEPRCTAHAMPPSDHGAAHPGRRDGCRPGVPTVEAAREEMSGAGHLGRRTRRRPQIAAPEPSRPDRRGGAGGLANAVGRRAVTGRRTTSGRHRAAAGGAAVGGHRRRDRAADGDEVTVSTARGAITLPLVITEMPDRVVWLPLNSPGSAVHAQLGAVRATS